MRDTDKQPHQQQYSSDMGDLNYSHFAAKFAGAPEIGVSTPKTPAGEGSFGQLIGELVPKQMYDLVPDGYQLKNRQAFSLPEIARGDAPIMGEIMDVVTFNANNFYTRELLPIVRTDKLKAQFTKWIFDPTLVDPLNEQGRVRTMQGRTVTMRAILSQYGKGINLPMEMLTRKEGMKWYATQLLQLRNAVEETNSFMVIHAILKTYNNVVEWERRLKKYRGKALWDILKDERDMFGIMQRLKTPMEVIETIISENQRLYKGRGDTYLIHSKMAAYLTQAAPGYTDIQIGGTDAIATRKDGIDSFQKLTRDARAYIVRSYQVADGSVEIDILLKYVAYGEYNEGFDRFRGGDYTGYRSAWRDIQIFDVGKDNWQTITLKYMLDNCGRFDPNDRANGGRMISFNDSRLQYQAKYDPALTCDSLHYRTANPKDNSITLVPCEYFGQVDREHFSADDIGALAFTAIQQMPEVFPAYRDGKAISILNTLVSHIEKMESIPFDAATNTFLARLATANAGQYVQNRGVGLKPLTPLDEFPANEYGVLDLPVVARVTDLTADQNFGLPPFYQSWAGLSYIAALYKQHSQNETELVKRGIKPEAAREVSEGVDLIRSIVANLRRQFPRSVAVDPRYASSWWHKPTAETVFFDTVVWQHRVPLWLLRPAAGGAGGGAGGGAAAPGDLVSGIADNLYKYVRSTFADRASRFVIAANAVAAGQADNLVKERIASAVNRLGALLDSMNAAALPGAATQADKAAAQAKTAILLLPFHLLDVKIQLDSIATTADGPARTAVVDAIAVRLLYVLDKFESQFALGVVTQAVDTYAASISAGGLVLADFESRFNHHMDTAVADASNPYRVNSSTVGNAKLIAKKIVNDADAVSKALQADATLRDAAIRRGAGDYRRSPLVYSPLQLQTHSAFATAQATANPPVAVNALLSNPEFPDEPMSVAVEKAHAIAISSYMQTLEPSKANTLAGPLRPGKSSTVRSAAPVHAMHIQSSMTARDGSRSGFAKRARPDASAATGVSIEENILGTLAPLPSAESERSALNIGVGIDTYNRISAHEGNVAPQIIPEYGASHMGAADYGEMTFGRPGKRPAGTLPYDDPRPARADLEGADSLDYNLSNRVVSYNFQELWKEVANAESLMSWIARVYMLTPVTKEACNAFISRHILFPFSFLLFRYNIQLGTYPLIKMLRGSDTGNSFLGNVMFTRSDDGDLRFVKNKFTYYFAAKVFFPENVYIANHAYIAQYIGGGGSQPINPFTYNPNDTSTDQGDIAVILEPYTLGGSHDNTISITGHAEAFGRVLTEVNPKSAIDYFNAPYYNKLYGWKSARDEQINTEAVNYYKFVDSGLNRIVHRGATKFYRPRFGAPGDFNAIRSSAGYIPTKNICPGLKDCWSGRLTAYNEFDYSSYDQV